jgi:hypothetical protein
VNQRRSSSSVNPIIILTVVGVVLAAAVYWFVIRDDSKDSSTGPKTFTAPGNSFSFNYPATFAETAGSAGYVFISGVGPHDYISVKRLQNFPTSPSRLAATMPRTLKAVPGTTITNQGTVKRDGVDMVTIAGTLKLDGSTVPVRLYFFSANGVTWQLGCAAETQPNVINPACSAALQSFKAS